MINVCVFCGSRLGHDSTYAEAARSLALELSHRNMQMIFGGGGTGLMGETARTALSLGVSVTGIIPKFLLSQETPVDQLNELIVVDDMHARKAKMAELADIFVVLPGGIGTMEETTEMLTGNWLGLYNKPVGLLNVNGFFDKFLDFLQDAVKTGFMPAPCFERVITDNSASKLLDKLIIAKNAPALPHNADCFGSR